MAFRNLYRVSSFAAAFAASGATTVASMSALNEVRFALPDTGAVLQAYAKIEEILRAEQDCHACLWAAADAHPT